MKRYLFLVPFLLIHLCANAQLSGTYYVGSNTGNDYETITEVINALKSQAISGDLTFVLESGTYDEVLEFSGLNNGSSSITFLGEDVSNTIIKPNNITVGGTAGIILNGVENISFENLTIDMENISSGTHTMNSNTTQGVYVEDATNIIFEGLQFLNANATGVNSDYVSASIYLYIVEDVDVNNCSFSGAANHVRFREYTNISITNCDFTLSQRPVNGAVNGSVTGNGLLVRSNTMSNVVQGMFMNAGKAINAGITSVVIDDNTISCVENAIDIRGLNDYEITANEITTSEADGIGIELSYTGRGTIENNIINAYEGIYYFFHWDDESSMTVANNFVSGVNYAIRLRNSNSVKLYHNSFRGTGEGDLSYSADGSYTINDPAKVIHLEGFLDTVYVVNNIISGAYLGDTLFNSGIDFDYPTFDSLYINFNLYDTALTSVIAENIGSLEVSDIAGEIITLTKWQKDDRAHDADSQSPDYEGSLFEATGDLHITDEVNFRFGTYMEDYDTDIDGHIRLEAGGIDVGADQYVGEVLDSFSCLDIYEEHEFESHIDEVEFCFENSCSESLEADTIILDYETSEESFSMTNLAFEISEADIDVNFDLYYQGAYLTSYNHLFEIAQDAVEEDSTYSSNLRIMYSDGATTIVDHCFSLNFAFSLAPGGTCEVALAAETGINTTDYSKGDQWYTYTNTTSDLQYVQATSYGYTSENTFLRLHEGCSSLNDEDTFDGGYDQSDLTTAVYPGETIYIQWKNEDDATYSFNWNLGFQDIQTYGALECDTTVQIYSGEHTIPYIAQDENRLFYYANESGVKELLTVTGKSSSRLRLLEACDGTILTSTGIRDSPVTGMFIEAEDTVFIRITGEMDSNDPYELEIETRTVGFEGLICELATEIPGFGDYTANMRDGHGSLWSYYVNDSDTTQAIQVTTCLDNIGITSYPQQSFLYSSCAAASSGSSVVFSRSESRFCDDDSSLGSSRSINYVHAGDSLFINWTGVDNDDEFTWSLNPFDGYIGGLSCDEPVEVGEGTHLANDEFGEQWYLYVNEHVDSLQTVRISSCNTIADDTNLKIYDACGNDALQHSEDGDCESNPYASEIIQEIYPGDSLYMVWLNSGEYIEYDWMIEVQSSTYFCDDTQASYSYDIETCDSYEFDGDVLTQDGLYQASYTNVHGCDSLVNLNLTVLEPTSGEGTVSTCESYEWEGTLYTATGTYQEVLTNSVGCDSTATLNLTILESTSGEETVSTCDSYEWEGTLYTATGTFQEVLTNSVGCDSTATLNLTILEFTSGEETVSACESYEWEGTLYTASGTYQEVLTNAVGCDSTATLNLTILESTLGEETVSVCESYEWEGTLYTTSGTYQEVLTNAVGCDSTATLNLTILESTLGEETVSVCESYEWEGTLYTTSGTYQEVLTNAVGCDSTATLNLTILESTLGEETVSACESYEWEGTLYTTSGTYQEVLTNAVGCDSTATLNLTILESTLGEETVSVCESYEWEGTLYTTSGTYQEVLTNAEGCDSTATLNLTILESTSGEETVSACESYEWEGALYTASGTYQEVLTNSVGCDSTVTLRLNILDPYDIQQEIAACEQFEFNGEMIIESGEYAAMFTAANGCDSLVTLNLTINDSYFTNTVIESCGSYVFGDQVLTESGVYEGSFLSLKGCDSVVNITYVALEEPNNGIVLNTGVLMAEDDSEGLTYRWINCNTGELIEGEDQRQLSPPGVGSYAVELANSVCQVTSNCYEILEESMILSVESQVPGPKIYPNPSIGPINIFWERPVATKVSLVRLDGRVVFEKYYDQTDHVSHSVDTPGIYVVRIQGLESGHTVNYKVIIR